MHRIYYKVRGHGRFPVDMLRYDRSFPVSEVESYKIEDMGNVMEDRTVELAHDDPNVNWVPGKARWIGWDVL